MLHMKQNLPFQSFGSAQSGALSTFTVSYNRHQRPQLLIWTQATSSVLGTEAQSHSPIPHFLLICFQVLFCFSRFSSTWRFRCSVCLWAALPLPSCLCPHPAHTASVGTAALTRLFFKSWLVLLSYCFIRSLKLVCHIK